MNCSICFEDITQQTGSTTLSCQHSFHFRCISSWFEKQVLDDLAQTCPCCRHEGSDSHLDRFELMLENEDDNSSSSSEDSEYEENESEDSDTELAELFMSQEWILERNVSTGQFLFTPAIEISLARVRSLFGPLNQLDEPDINQAAQKIQAVYRGYKTRRTIEVEKAARSLAHLFFYARHA